MTQTPNSPAELLLQQIQLEGKEEQANRNPVRGLTPQQIVDFICSESSDLQPTQVIELSGILLQNLLNFHMNACAKVLEDNDGNLPSHEMFWLSDSMKLDQCVTLIKQVLQG